MRRPLLATFGMLALLGAGAGDAATFIDTKAQAALTAMKNLNAIILGDWNAGDEVEGKVWVGGNANQYNGHSKTQVGFGNSGQSSGQSSDYRTLTVVGNLHTGIDLYNGATKNGKVGTVDSNATGSYGAIVGGSQTEGNNGLGTKDANAYLRIGGNAAKLALDYAAADVIINGTLNGNTNFNGSGMTVRALSYTGNTNSLNGGTTVNISGSNPNGGNTPPTGWNFNASQTLDAPTTSGLASGKSTMIDNMHDLTSQLGGLTANNMVMKVNNDSASVYDYLFNVTNTSPGYAVFNVAASDLFNARNVGFITNGSSAPIVINISGIGSGSFNWDNNGLSYTYNGKTSVWDSSLNSQIIWNFKDATSSSALDVTAAMHGSILDPLGTVSNTAIIEGSVVASVFNQKSEVHLGTFNGADTGTSAIAALATVTAGAVPEPHIWAMMIVGFCAIGGIIRRQKQLGVLIRI